MTSPPDLTGRRILVLEDEYHIATDTSRALIQAGAQVIGPVPSERAALELIAADLPSAALLDINLDGVRSFELAAELRARGVPVVFMTGYDADVIPAALGDAPLVRKPAGIGGIAAALTQAIELKE